MDRYMDIKNAGGFKILPKEYHLVGLVSIFISSKYDDVRPISLRKLLIKVGHTKFTVEEVLKTEIEVLRTLGFKVSAESLTHAVFNDLKIIFKAAEMSERQTGNDSELGITDYMDLLTDTCTFILMLATHSSLLSVIPIKDMVGPIIYVSLTLADLINIESKTKSNNKQDSEPHPLDNLFKEVKDALVADCENRKNFSKLCSKIFNYIDMYDSSKIRNLYKSYPLYETLIKYLK
jgi:hypothetical protein